jgi:hypothetical protein
MSERIEKLARKCKQFSNPFRTEHSALVANEPTKLGVEVVYLKAGGHSTKKPLIRFDSSDGFTNFEFRVHEFF